MRASIGMARTQNDPKDSIIEEFGQPFEVLNSYWLGIIVFALFWTSWRSFIQ